MMQRTILMVLVILFMLPGIASALGTPTMCWQPRNGEHSCGRPPIHKYRLPPAGIETLSGSGLGKYRTDILESATAAINYWRRLPCGGHVIIFPGTYDGARNVFGEASWVGPMSDPTECGVALSEHYLGPIQAVAHPYRLCTTITHEFGHFFGYEDTSTDPYSVNYPVTNESMIDIPCSRRWRHIAGEETPQEF